MNLEEDYNKIPETLEQVKDSIYSIDKTISNHL